MLCGISPLVCPELLAALSRMGHGDEIVFADAHFPAESINSFVIRMDGLKIVDLLHGVLPLLALDEYVDFPVIMMAPVDGDTLNEDLITDYHFAIDKHRPQTPGDILLIVLISTKGQKKHLLLWLQEKRENMAIYC